MHTHPALYCSFRPSLPPDQFWPDHTSCQPRLYEILVSVVERMPSFFTRCCWLPIGLSTYIAAALKDGPRFLPAGSSLWLDISRSSYGPPLPSRLSESIEDLDDFLGRRILSNESE